MDDEPFVTAANPGLAKLAMYLLGLLAALGTYVWTNLADKVHALESRQSTDHDTLIILQTNSTEVKSKIDHVIQILEDQQKGRRR